MRHFLDRYRLRCSLRRHHCAEDDADSALPTARRTALPAARRVTVGTAELGEPPVPHRLQRDGASSSWRAWQGRVRRGHPPDPPYRSLDTSFAKPKQVNSLYDHQSHGAPKLRHRSTLSGAPTPHQRETRKAQTEERKTHRLWRRRRRRHHRRNGEIVYNL